MRYLKFTIWFFSFVFFAGLCVGAYFWYVWSSNLPYIGSVKEYRPPIITEVYSDDGEVIGRLWDEKRIIIPLEELPQHLIHSFVAAEDSRFFEHEGVDIISIIRAFFKNLRAGRIEQGGSTITQQVTKSLLLKNTKRTYRRKAREAILSIQLDKNFSKKQILFLYLNQIYLGQGAYGVEAAARTYFNKSAKDLVLAESALLAGLVQAPSRYSPVSHFDRARARQKYVLERMSEEGYITHQEVMDVLGVQLDIQTTSENTFEKAPYFTEYVRQYLLKKYGRELLYRGGLKVYTTLNLRMQREAREALRGGLSALDKREGYRGPFRHLAPEEIPGFKAEAMEVFSTTPPEINSIVQGIVEKVDDQKKEVALWIGGDMGRLPVSRMRWAREPDSKIAYYEAKVKEPSQVLREGDVVLVRVLKEGLLPGAWEVSLEQSPDVQGALLSMLPGTCEVKAMVGGRDYTVSQFNRAIQARRQPGSAFKPLIYCAA
ncbi:MAG: transglycosylase domain-containing protein, partial [Desulfobacteraceae bacterium]|nr:transglycosylase domain-containing protein [Desulfobacteraceae bacterium]